MNDEDSKQEILKDWNSHRFEEEIPYRKLTFNDFEDLYRYLIERSHRQGKEIRKNELNSNEKVNIIAPMSPDGNQTIKRRKKRNEKFTTSVLEFLNRIKILKQSKKSKKRLTKVI
ncbi:MAG: hypothetical protein A3C79_03450 [Candidatus Taylorbacteria bacterium RIFCSPHIGHO2_02_FULL_45_28]|uniref:Uncharacterized protein n=1 Tax=Candidatus Taylorbacteria bacterium RIFCSPHIGHO2_12_FULL_45_16 TaxID=1802315 RepID=A0A1G2N0Y8_9BACT|nr:MAG: hypothetical protein A2830_01160 [Candidatus Taylorbacteria bacterium RIFCSPHIGHO2_01_FULL_44_110]OHA25012.1 MAG: hypothetical protein A3C79_03450 [Candidatus Taylorbacteria bacterium RIFCSPHIGHO2_02_FULL_45_28]OHA29826.1 MAG: hypothetical protein A3F51_03845 [Candidatus Taylorbacteria bacterium RIFCSPHIGHO2_12_FULL_45_16]OHA32772.1 MAG: hypothetical protein A3A23_00725 [Candidatus Taylorbacteria bacterium RIFCSPLOWO2_01_FULL_45_59]